MAAAPTMNDAHARAWRWREFFTLGGVVNDGAFVYGLKFGLAGILSLFIALVIRAQDPTWALFTVYVLMIAQYVGAIGEKSIFRLIGTIIGGLIGYGLTASLEQNPVIFLLLTGTVVAFCTAMFGQSRYPYAFLLCGLTVVVVVSNGLTDPDNSWQYMLWRIEEVTIGIVATIIVQVLFWPRYAAVEFTAAVRSACADLRECFATSARIFLDGDAGGHPLRAIGFPARISALRGMLEFGGRESLYFRARLPTFFNLTSCLSRIAQAITTLDDRMPEECFYRAGLATPLRTVHETLEAALEALSHPNGTVESRRQRRAAIEDAFQKMEASMAALRDHPKIFEVPPEEAMLVGLHVLALENVREEIHRLHELQDSLPENPAQYSREIEPLAVPIPSPAWIHGGIKSGVAVVAALIIENWLHPPNPTMFVLGSWVFTAMNSNSPGGQGDRRAYNYIVYSILAMIGLSVAMLTITPMMSSYAVMNTILFTWLFVWGYLSYNARGMTIPMQFAMLVSVGMLALNAQEPVPFQSIVGFFYGTVLAALMAGVIQRTLWPSLPQRELQKRFVEYLRLCHLILTQGPDHLPLWQKVRLALIPGEAMPRIPLLTPPICPPGEQEILFGYLDTLQRVGGHLIGTVGRLEPMLPGPHAATGKKLITQLETAMKGHLESHARDIEAAVPVAVDDTALRQTLELWLAWLAEIRAWMIEQKYPMAESLRILGLAGRYHQTGEDFLRADAHGAKLRLSLYMGDYVL